MIVDQYVYAIERKICRHIRIGVIMGEYCDGTAVVGRCTLFTRLCVIVCYQNCPGRWRFGVVQTRHVVNVLFYFNVLLGLIEFWYVEFIVIGHNNDGFGLIEDIVMLDTLDTATLQLQRNEDNVNYNFQNYFMEILDF